MPTPTLADYTAAVAGPSEKNKPTKAETPVYENFTTTKDPDTVIGKYGLTITKNDMDNANKHGMAWESFPEFAEWLGGFAHQAPDWASVAPYYKHHGNSQNIQGSDIALLMARNDPKINEILARGTAPKGQVPEFGPEDGDRLKSYISYYKNQPSAEDYANTVVKNQQPEDQ